MKKFFTKQKTKVWDIGKLFSLVCLITLTGTFNGSIAQSTNPSPYCATSHQYWFSNICGNNYGFDFLNIRLNGASHNSSCDNNTAYRFWNNLGTWTTLSPGATYTIYMQTASTVYQTSAGAWIDYNDDKNFGTNEWLGGTAALGTNAPVFARTFTVPCSAKPGLSRLRVRCDYWQAMGAGNGCGASVYGYGETMDFTIMIATPGSPSANFSLPDTVYTNAPTRFVNANQTGYISHEWDVFNFGTSPDATATDFNYTFTDTGTYQMKLTSTNCGGSASATKSFTVMNPTRRPKADFIASKNEIIFTGSNLEYVDLYDLSQYGTSNWEWIITPDQQALAPWDFSNGSSAKYDQNTNLYFYGEEKYDVCLVASNALGSDTACKFQYIKVVPPGAGSNFSNTMGVQTGSDLDSGVIYDSGGRFNDYSNNEFNTFLIAPCAATEVKLSFVSFDTENNVDKLNVYDGTSASGNLLATISGNTLPQTLVAKSGKMFLEFQSNGTTTKPGFEARWSATMANDGAPKADFILPDTIYACSGGTDFIFKNASSGILEGQADYDWIFEYDPFITYPASYCEACDEESPEWSYSTNQTYSVRMVLKSCEGNDTIVKSFVLENTTNNPIVDFSVDKRKVKVGESVQLVQESVAGCSYEWSIFPSSYTLEGGSLLTDRNITVRLTGKASYNITLKVTNDNGTTTRTKNNFIDAIEWCAPVVTLPSIADVGINKVTIASIENESASGEAPGYTDYTADFEMNMIVGNTYSITIERNGTVNMMNRKVWIDWNRDGDFDDAGELVAAENAANTRSFTANITVPALANLSLGETRLRIGTSINNSSNTPCGPNSVGEFEDYKVNIIRDDVPPTITLVGADTITFEVNNSYTEFGATAFDNIEGNITNRIQITNTVDTAQAGLYYVFYQVTDGSGLQSPMVRRVVMVASDLTNPVITLNGANPLVHPVKTPFVDPMVTVIDNPGNANISANANASSNLDENVVGDYTIIYDVVDAYGNQATATRLVQVRDLDAPVINTADKVNLQVLAPFNYELDAVDNYDAQVSVTVLSGFVNSNVIGVYNVTYRALDMAGNTVDKTIEYTVGDFIAPVLSTIPGTDIFLVDVGNVDFIEPAVTAVDNYYPSVQVTRDASALDVFKLGNYPVIYTATDLSNNVATYTRTIRVVDKTAPEVLVFPLNVERWSTVDPMQDVLVRDNYNTPQWFTDNNAVKVIFNNVDANWPGWYTIRYVATDESGNKSFETDRVVRVSETTSVGALDAGSLNVYPNPSNAIFNVEFTALANSVNEVVVSNSLGQSVMTFTKNQLQNGSLSLDMSAFTSGVYFVKLVSEQGVLVQKVSLNK